jgi:hypothetical protein
LKWLATLALSDVRIEAVGLRAIYRRYHAEQADQPRLDAAEKTP